MKMKAWISVGLCAYALAFAAACSNGPEDVAVKVMEAVRDNDEKVLEENCTSLVASMLQFQSAIVSDAMLGMKFKALDSKITGDRAVVKIQAKMDGKTTTQIVTLAKIDGKWKVNAW